MVLTKPNADFRLDSLYTLWHKTRTMQTFNKWHIHNIFTVAFSSRYLHHITMSCHIMSRHIASSHRTIYRRALFLCCCVCEVGTSWVVAIADIFSMLPRLVFTASRALCGDVWREENMQE